VSLLAGPCIIDPVRLVLGWLLGALLFAGCASETPIALRFIPFVCAGVPPGSSLFVTTNEIVTDGQQTRLRRLADQTRCLSQTVAIDPIAVAQILRQQGGFLAGVPADRETQLVMLISLSPSCTDPWPVCLVSDAIRAGGEPQTVNVRGVCNPQTGPPPAWAPCAGALSPL
jgi:hypothetical protein